jgi:energy-coupling factor transporter ATP-binding protein EcfA2
MPSHLQHGQFEVVGATFIGPAPLGRVDFKLASGATVLYGVNGAGKSRLLAALHRLLRGVAIAQAEAFFTVRVVDTEAMLASSTWGDALLDAVYTTALEDPMWAGFVDADGRPEAFVDAVKTSVGYESDPDDPITAAVAAQGLLTVHAVGTDESPEWAVYFAARDAEVHLPAAPERQVADLVVRAAKPSCIAHLHADDQAVLLRVAGMARRSMRGEGTEEEGLYLLSGSWKEELLLGVDQRRLSILTGGWVPGIPNVTPRDLTPPDWAATPCWFAGHVQEPLLAVLAEEPGEALDRRTLEVLLRTGNRLLDVADEAEVVLATDVGDVSERLDAAATATYAMSPLPEARLTFHIGHPEQWIRGGVPYWVMELSGGGEIPLKDASFAESRWAALAVSVALHREQNASEQASMWLSDEPERGLHRTAEARLPSVLDRFGAELNIASVVATHSPALLRPRLVNLLHVSRDPITGRTAAIDLAVDVGHRGRLLQVADELGLTVADVLQLVRVIVAVEGRHDQTVLKALLPSELDQAGAWILPMSGAKNSIAVLDAQVLLDATDAHFIVVVDGIRQTRLDPLWAEVTELAVSGQTDAARGRLRHIEDLATGNEGYWLRELADRALDLNLLHRISAHGLEKRDIICYLPPASLLGAPDLKWHDVEKEYDQYVAGLSRYDKKKNFKEWLQHRYGARITNAAVHRAVGQLTDLCSDISRLGDRIVELGDLFT